ncbi:MAG: MBL fold metallo-hydrolase, partial [Thermoanaerobaculia bacterium]|nr:MBL fold metallo-hydrolase [Thermoanaerobaculia bacterium]
PAPASRSIPEQLAEIFGVEDPAGPFGFDLLVVTHAHQDHIGCLPEMVDRGVVTTHWALVADEELGWGGEAIDALTAADPKLAEFWAALREERPVFASEAALEAFLADAASLRDRYHQMLERLVQDGTRVLRYGRDPVEALEAILEPEGLRIIGPTKEHLEICREVIASIGRDALDFVQARLASDSRASTASLVREFLATRAGGRGVDSASLDFSASTGNALNCQSIVLVAERNGRKVLLTGDMQLADPRVSGLGNSMKALRQKIAATGPFDMVKLPHHAAANGFNGSVLEEVGTPFLTISTGPGSGSHPHPEVLALLEEAQGKVTWLRTDRNGRIAVDYSTEEGEILWERGKEDDLSRNHDPDGAVFLGREESSGRAEPAPAPAVSPPLPRD